MKIELSEKQCFDIEWAILISIDTVQRRYKKEKKEINTPLTKKLIELHDYIQKTRKETNE
tara:strand:- start:1151 stop:1330 length:180 start_codon:yes stop_codon:yes gene_type:complete